VGLILPDVFLKGLADDFAGLTPFSLASASSGSLNQVSTRTLMRSMMSSRPDSLSDRRSHLSDESEHEMRGCAGSSAIVRSEMGLSRAVVLTQPRPYLENAG